MAKKVNIAPVEQNTEVQKKFIASYKQNVP